MIHAAAHIYIFIYINMQSLGMVSRCMSTKPIGRMFAVQCSVYIILHSKLTLYDRSIKSSPTKIITLSAQRWLHVATNMVYISCHMQPQCMRKKMLFLCIWIGIACMSLTKLVFLRQPFLCPIFLLIFPVIYVDWEISRYRFFKTGTDTSKILYPELEKKTKCSFNFSCCILMNFP